MNKNDIIKREALEKLSVLVKSSIETYAASNLPLENFVVEKPIEGYFTKEESQEVERNFKEMKNSQKRLYIFCKNNNINLPKEFESYLQRIVNEEDNIGKPSVNPVL